MCDKPGTVGIDTVAAQQHIKGIPISRARQLQVM